jgi:hypothetical protein
MSGPKLKIARSGYDTRTAANKDLALNTELTILKIVKIIRSTSNQSVAHGLGYAPQVMFLRELQSSPKQVGHAISAPLLQSNNSSDSTNINFQKIDSGDSAVTAIVFADPFGSEDMKTTNTTGRPIIKVGSDRLYSPYDTLKVFESDTLTLNVPEWTSSAGTDSNTVTATYTHNLGYVPLFAPFIPAQTSLTIFYNWYWQWHNRSSWATSREYLVDDYVQNPGGTFYICTQYHTSSSATEPGSGANWEDYWVLSSDLMDLPGAPGEIPDRTIDLNSLEDYKIVFGGAFAFTDETVYVYATTTQLVIKYVRTDSQAFGYSTFPARTVNLGYTIFYNNIEEDLNLL